jgi:cation diffusion facilitator CzcD-associated flavoprotein CzcO
MPRADAKPQRSGVHHGAEDRLMEEKDTPPARRCLDVAVIGAGASGLVAARAMRDAGHRVVVFEGRSDLGGVWAASRAYPGLGTQNDKGAYSFSDLRMPDDWPNQPTGAQMREYLHRYVDDHALKPLIRFGRRALEVRRQVSDWAVTVETAGRRETHSFNAVVIASGVFSHPFVPEWAGRDAFELAGGQVLLPEQIDVDALKGRRIAVIGWGKTACDLAVTLAPYAAATTIVARVLRWKTPQPDRLRLHEIIMLTRTGEWMMYPQRKRLPRVVHHYLRTPARLLCKLAERIISRKHGLRELGMLPTGGLSEVSNQVTPGLFEAIRAGDIVVKHGAEIESLQGGETRHIRLASGAIVPADVVVVATGYRPRLDYLDAPTISALVNTEGCLTLERHVHSDSAPGLYFVGLTGNISGLTSAEASALWAAAHLAGWPGVVGRSRVKRESAQGEKFTAVPSAMLADIDGQLADMGRRLPFWIRVQQWLRPIDADDYAPHFAAIRRRLQASFTTGEDAALSAAPLRTSSRVQV